VTTNILVVDDEVAIRRALERFLTGLDYQVWGVENAEDALKIIHREVIDLALIDLVMPKMDGVELIRRIKAINPNIVAIVMTAYGTITSAVEAMKSGAYHYLTKPFELEDIASLVATGLEHQQLKEENRYLKRQLKSKYKFDNIIGNSESMQQVFSLIEKVADTDSTILILGESGTGKELVAKAIHYNSQRENKPLITVNCGAIPEELLESELFGHMKGAFTGAHSTKPGRFDAADGGTIFLDEIGDMSPKLQVKILRVLQERKFEPVGSTKTHEVDVRIITATNQNLEEAVKNGKFREDLFYRLNVIPINIPPLRERRSDIPLLLQHFISRYNEANERSVEGISNSAAVVLENYDWPGNVRELENLMERIIVLKGRGDVSPDDLPSHFQDIKERGEMGSVYLPSEGLSFKEAVGDFEKKIIKQALDKTKGNKNKAASLLKLNRTTLVEKIKKMGIGA
jgi:DNA-binding NtrC family response regulator